MSQAKNDRNIVVFGPDRASFEYKIDRVEEQIEDFQREVNPIVNDYEAGTIGGGGSFIGEVATYDPNTLLGTFIDTEAFYNGTGFGLGTGDQVVYTDINGQNTAISIYFRAGSYTPLVVNNPQANNNFPYDGDALPTQHNPDPQLAVGTVAYSPSTTRIATTVGFYATGVLGYTGRIVVMLGGNDRIEQPLIAIYHVETGSLTNISRAAAVGATNRTRGLGAVGTRLFVTYDGISGNCVESWDSTTGVWTTHAIHSAVYAGVSGGRAWWVGYSVGGTRYRIHSIDSSGTLSSIDYPISITYATSAGVSSTNYVFAKAKNGRLWASLQTGTASNNKLVTCSTGTAAASVSLTSYTSPCSTATSPNWGNDGQFLWSRVTNAGATDYRDLTQAETSSDTATNGDLWYALRAGSPACWAFAVISATTGAQTVYGTIMSSTGDPVNGEAVMFGGLYKCGSEAVFFGSTWEKYYNPASTRTFSWLPTFWRSDGTITAANVDANYTTVVANGALSDGINVSGISRAIPRYDTTDTTFVFVENIGNNVETLGSLTTAGTTGPCLVNALTV